MGFQFQEVMSDIFNIADTEQISLYITDSASKILINFVKNALV